MQRRSIPELLDTDSGSQSEVAASLKDLRWFNRWFGGISTTARLIEMAAGAASRVSVLDVAGGEGFVLKNAQRYFPKIKLDLTVLDRAPTHLLANGCMQAVCGDALALPFQNSSFDFVFSSLFVHHLAPEKVVLFVRESVRVSRVAVLVNDLVRHPVHLVVAYAGLPLYRSRLTRHDAPASVRQAYTVKEIEDLLHQAGARRVEIFRNYFFRMGAIAWKPE